jgi:hypothetical protein
MATLTGDRMSGRHTAFAFVLSTAFIVAGALGSTSAGAASCPNADLRTGPSANLPDCRAYELVVLPDMEGIPPSGRIAQDTNGFDQTLASDDGGNLLFLTHGQDLPGTQGNGFENGYMSERGTDSWTISLAGPDGAESELPIPGGSSPDVLYSAWAVFAPPDGFDHGSLAAFPGPTNSTNSYVRGPDGDFELIGQGSLGIDPAAQAHWITPGAQRIIFDTNPTFSAGDRVQLEPDAPPTGTGAIYERAIDGSTQVVSLLPGDLTPPTGDDASYQGVSEDGSAVAFKLGSDPSLYVRKGGTSHLVTASPNTFAGLSRDGGQAFYERGGDLFSYDIAADTATQITTGGGAQFVNVSADGSHVFFVSTEQLDPPAGTPGAPNLYVWNRGTAEVAFIALLDPADSSGGPGELSLVNWANGPARHDRSATDPSRTTPDGDVLVFESRAQLTGYDNQGHSEIYRYSASDGTLTCVSCNPSGFPSTGDAHLQAISQDNLSPTIDRTVIPNVTLDGQLIAFQTFDSLSARDTNGAQDIYTWRDGEISLISTGQSPRDSYLYAMTPNGGDIFFTTNQELVSQDHNGGSRTIYDARVNGGFSPDVSPPPCVGDACQGPPSPPPLEPGSGSSVFQGSGNDGKVLTQPARRCKKHRVLRKGKCVRKHRKHRGRSK